MDVVGVLGADDLMVGLDDLTAVFQPTALGSRAPGILAGHICSTPNPQHCSADAEGFHGQSAG